MTSNADSGPGTLRQAIVDAYLGDEIVFAPWIATIDLTSGPIQPTYSVTIRGPGSDLLTIRRSLTPGTPPFRIFTINGTNTISGITISNGNAPSNDGGGILIAAGVLTLVECVVSGNSAPGGNGGGIAIRSGRIEIYDSTISGNSAASGRGGGISNGGGLVIVSSTISGNTAEEGGGVYTSSSQYTRSAENSTITGNSATSVGGGIYDALGATTLTSSIVAVNSAPSSPDFDGQLVSQGFNIFGSIEGASFVPETTDILGATSAQLLLGPLQQNGGTTPTHAPAFGSIAIDAGVAGRSASDQRGLARPVDSPTIANNGPDSDGSDVGAHEVQPDILPGCSTISRLVSNGNDSGAGSLRGVMADVCNGSTITFSPSVSTVTLTTGELLLDKSLKIFGRGSDQTRIVRSDSPGTPEFRIINIPSARVEAVIARVAIENGFLAGEGGGINLRYGRLTLEDAIVAGNTGRYGAGINNVLGSLALRRVAISGNTAQGDGGGIRNDWGELVLSDTVISGNSANNAGGIFYAGSSISIRQSTISNNSAVWSGGGIYATSRLTLVNMTISGNAALSSSGRGGGIICTNNLRVFDSTIVGNSSAGDGGGIFNPYPTGTIVQNSILALNTAPQGPDFRGNLDSQGFNLIGSPNGAVITPPQSSDRIGVSAAQLNLGPLQDDGGFTPTHALRPGSFAIDKGFSASSTDQRGYHRPIDQLGIPDAVGGDGSDVGAFEYLPEPNGLLTMLVALVLLSRFRGRESNRVTAFGRITGPLPRRSSDQFSREPRHPGVQGKPGLGS